MPLRSESITVGGATYEVQQLPAMRASRLFARLAGVLAPALSKGAAALPKGATGILDANVGDLGEAFGILAAKLDPDVFEGVLKDLLYCVKRTDPKPFLNVSAGSGTGFDEEFAGRFLAVVELAAFAFQLNYGDFYAAVRTLVAKAPRTDAKAPPSSE